MLAAVRVEDPGKLADTIASHLVGPGRARSRTSSRSSPPQERLTRIAAILEAEVEKLQVDRRIQGRVKKQMERAQKEYYLNEKMKAIQKELGRKDDRRSTRPTSCARRSSRRGCRRTPRRRRSQELKRLEAMPPMSAEATVSRNYLDWLIAVPWRRSTRERQDLPARRDDPQRGPLRPREGQGAHRRVPRRAPARRTSPRARSCASSARPGVGKTSLARSIARCTNRKFVRLSLGGVRDEAEIRGHRRTYIGAFPGQIIQMMKKAGARNPVFLLDEVDKMSMDFRGDPSAALLEVLDPEQNNTFTDHYLDVEFDLSSVFFIATANVLHTIPQALQDRLEVIRLPGYTEQREGRDRAAPPAPEADRSPTASTPAERRASREDALAGAHPPLHARGRRAQPRAGDVHHLPQGGAQGRRSRGADVRGRDHRREPRASTWACRATAARSRRSTHEIGLATGLAWTEVGGEILPIEVTLMPGKGALRLTGKLGDVMQESAHAAMSFVRSRAEELRHRARASTASSTSTSTCPRAPSPRTAPPPASRCARPSSRR